MEPIVLTEPRDGHHPISVSDGRGLRELREDLRPGLPLAIDTERASGFRYDDRAFLIQLKQESIGTFLIDPIEIHSQLGTTLQPIFGECPWILHAAVSDLPSLNELGLHPTELFDTEIAGRFLGYDHVNLAAISERVLGYRLKKGHGAENWSRRPLPRSWLRYAALDVELLIDLAEALTELLSAEGKLEWAQQEFDELVTHPPVTVAKTFRSLPAMGRMRPKNLQVARALWNHRDRLARDRDLAPGRILPNQTMKELALTLPVNVHQTAEILRRHTRSDRRASMWFRVINLALKEPRDRWPQPQQKDGVPPKNLWKSHYPQAHDAYHAVHTALEDLGTELSVDPVLLASGNVLRELVWRRVMEGENLDVDAFLQEQGAREWQRTNVGPVLQATLDVFPSAPHSAS